MGAISHEPLDSVAQIVVGIRCEGCAVVLVAKDLRREDCIAQLAQTIRCAQCAGRIPASALRRDLSSVLFPADACSAHFAYRVWHFLHVFALQIQHSGSGFAMSTLAIDHQSWA